MGYNDRNPTFSFRLGEYRHSKVNKLAAAVKMPTADYVRKIFDQFINGDLIEKPKDELSVKMTLLKIRKLEADIKYMELKNKYLETFGTPLSNSAVRILKPQVAPAANTWHEIEQRQISPYDEKNKRLQCVECQQIFSWQNYEEFNEQLTEYQRQITNLHGRALNHLEKTACFEVNFHGASS